MASELFGSLPVMLDLRNELPYVSLPDFNFFIWKIELDYQKSVTLKQRLNEADFRYIDAMKRTKLQDLQFTKDRIVIPCIFTSKTINIPF